MDHENIQAFIIATLIDDTSSWAIIMVHYCVWSVSYLL